jgi:Holliday junction resolvase RusA-like endonuclease
VKIKQILRTEVIGDPKPQGSKNGFVRGGRVVMVEANKGHKDWRANVANQISLAVRGQNWEKIDKTDTAHVSILFVFEKPKSVKRIFMTVKPDLDKLIRAILDGITQSGDVWQDDSQVVSLFVAKEYGEEAKAVIEVASGL